MELEDRVLLSGAPLPLPPDPGTLAPGGPPAPEANQGPSLLAGALSNSDPTGVSDAYVVNEDGTLSVPAAGVLANDLDPDGQPLSALLVSAPTNGSLTLNEDGSFVYSPNSNFTGTDVFSYRAYDGLATSAPTSVTITVNPGNDAPVAFDNYYLTLLSLPISIGGPGVLGNDFDPEGDSLTALLVSGPSHGSVTLNPNGSFTYTPNLLYLGSDSFTYRASDGTNLSNIATVNINVGGSNDAPTAANESYNVAEDATLVVPAAGVLANDNDSNGDALSALLATGPANGSLNLAPDGSFVYTPQANFNGVDTFTYWATDGDAISNLATVTINVSAVDDEPVAASDSYTVNEDGTLNIAAAAGVLANDTEMDGQTLSALLVAGPTNGSLTFSPDGSFVYTPNLNFNGIDGFQYQATDGLSNSNVVSVTLNVTAVNDPPAAVDDSYALAEDGVLNVAATASVLSNDSDVEGQPLTAVLVGGPANGTLSLNPDGSFTYTPNANFNGVDSFTYRASDGLANSSLATVTLTIGPADDPPTAATDNYTVAEDGILNVGPLGVLANDGEVDGQPLSALLVSGPANGSLTLNADGSFSYAPNAHFNGTDTFQYRASDGALASNVALVVITVTAVDDPPAAADDSYSLNEDGVLNVAAAAGLLSNDSDVEGQPLTAVLVGGPANGTLTLNTDGSFTYTPNANFNGVDSFTYRASDGTNNSNLATVTIAVAPVNDLPVAAGDSYTIAEDGVLNIGLLGVLANDSDVDGTPLLALLVTGPADGVLTFNADGSFTYTPNANFHGTDIFQYRATDGSLNSNVATVTITVNSMADPPTAQNDSYSVSEDGVLNITATAGVLANDFDVDVQPLTGLLVAGPTHGTLAFNADGSFVYTPDANFFGADSFTYRASDGTLSSSVATVAITVVPVNDAPTAADDSYSLLEDGVLNVQSAGLLNNDADADGQPLTALLVAGPSHGQLVLNADGTFRYTPDANYFGSDGFTYRLSDGVALSNVATVSLGIAAVNDAPMAAQDQYIIAPENTLAATAPGVLANDADVEGAAITAVLVSGPAHGQLVLNADGSFTYTPSAGYAGTDTFAYIATDGVLSSQPVNVTLSIQVVAPPPPTPPGIDPAVDPGIAPTEGGQRDDGAQPSDGEGDVSPGDSGISPQPLPEPIASAADTTRIHRPPAGPPPATLAIEARATLLHEHGQLETTVPSELPRSADSVLTQAAATVQRTAAKAARTVAHAVNYFDEALLDEDLRQLARQFEENAQVDLLAAGSAVGVSSVLTVGYVLWTVRGGALVVGLLAQMPAWRLIDPLVVLDYLEDEQNRPNERANEEDDSLEDLFRDAKANASAASKESIR